MTVDEFFAKHKELNTQRAMVITNYKRIPVNDIQMNSEGAVKFTELYQDLLKTDLDKLIRTPSGGISNAPENKSNNMYAYDVRDLKSMVEITIRAHIECRIQFRQVKDNSKMCGWQAFQRFKYWCEKFGINLEDYEDNDKAHALAVKGSIAKSKVCLADDMWKDKIISNAHHVDFHSSWPAGLCNKYPEFRPVVEFLYNRRHEYPENKLILNASIGYMQSAMAQVRARWAALSKAAIEDNNARIDALAQRLDDAGYTIIAYNTDGIWYAGGEPYHGEGEGNNLGQWENDHAHCQLRFKSPGAYEYIEDGQYTPVVRGRTNLEKSIPRSEWKWGDIYQNASVPIRFKFVEGIGIVEDDTEDEYYDYYD